MKVGLALKPGTPVEAVFPFVEMLDQVLIMTVEPVRRCSGLSSEIDRLMMHCCIM
jgi:pentose-5-phosphate-3-epimerase